MTRIILPRSMAGAALLAAYLLPMLAVIWLIARYGVNVPLGDEWTLVPSFESFATGDIGLRDLQHLNNEHRVILPRFILAALAWVSGWNVIWEMYASLVVAAFTFLMYYRLAAQRRADPVLFHLAGLTTALLAFSPDQYGNWLTGWHFIWFLPDVLVAGAILVLASPAAGSADRRLILAGVLCVLASLSAAQGLFSWIALLPSVACLYGRRGELAKRLVPWLGIFVLSVVVYLIDFQAPGGHPSVLYLLHAPWPVMQFFLTMLGAAIESFESVAALVGVVLCGVYIFFLVYAARHRKSQLARDLAPWLSLGLFTLLFAAAATVGRAGFGLESALAGRYKTTTVILFIALVQMARIFVEARARAKPAQPAGVRAYALVTGVLIGAVVIDYAHVAGAARAVRAEREPLAACLEVVHHQGFARNGCLGEIDLPVSGLKRDVATLERIGFRSFPRDLPFVDAVPGRSYGRIQADAAAPSRIYRRAEIVRLSGIALLPEQRRPARVVLLFYGEPRTYLASAVVNREVAELAGTLPPRHARAGWQSDIVVDYLPVGESAIHAWAYDHVARRFVRLDGEVRVTRAPD